MSRRPKKTAKVQNPPTHTSSPEPRWPSLLAALGGVVWFLMHGGYVAWNPFNNRWLLRSARDFTQHYLGWAHFRDAAWSFPIGKLPDLGWPVGTSIAMTDSNPLLCVLFKPFAAILPDTFQFSGPFMTLAFALQGYAASEILRLMGAKPWARLFGAALFIVAPPFLFATRHEILVAHWFDLWALALCFIPLRLLRPSTLILNIAVMTFLATAMNPYLLAMVAPLAVAAAGRWTFSHQPRDYRTGLSALGAMGAIVMVVAFSFGYAGGSGAKNLLRDGFGVFAADLTTFFNPHGWSRFLPNQPEHYGQYEGFAYFGLGGLFLVGAAICMRFRKTNQQPGQDEWRYVAVAAATMTLYALSDTICWRGTPLINLRPYTQSLLPLLSIFRSSGRFINIPFYALMFWAIVTLVRRCSTQMSQSILAVALVLQLIDLVPQGIDDDFRKVDWPLTSPTWAFVEQPYKRIAIFPPTFTDSEVNCGLKFPPRFELPFGVLSAQKHLTVNSAFAGYVDREAVMRHCKATADSVLKGEFADDTVYIVHPQALALFTQHAKDIKCGHIDTYNICVRRGSGTPLETALSGTT